MKKQTHILVSTDLHLTDNIEDEYRWDIFSILKNNIESDTAAVLITGDLTDYKNRHSSKLVNRIVKELFDLSQLCDVVLLMGNHDYEEDPDSPFFGFLNYLPNVQFYKSSGVYAVMDTLLYLVPNRGSKLEDREDFKFDHLELCSAAFFHETFSGAISSNGRPLKGTPVSFLSGFRGRCFSGDVHVQQSIGSGRVDYIGAPYPVRYGDTYSCRILKYYADGMSRDIPTTNLFPRKESVLRLPLDSAFESIKDLRLKKGDMLKATVVVPTRFLEDWKSIRNQIQSYCEGAGIHLGGLKPVSPVRRVTLRGRGGSLQLDSESVVKAFAKKKGLSESLLNAGVEFVEGINCENT